MILPDLDCYFKTNVNTGTPLYEPTRTHRLAGVYCIRCGLNWKGLVMSQDWKEILTAMGLAGVILLCTFLSARAEVVTYSAPAWCRPCQQMQPLLTKLGIRHIDIDKEPELAERAHIKAVPTTIVTDDNGREITRFVGKLSESRLKQLKQRPVIESVRKAVGNAIRTLFGQRGVAW